jgi:transposase-like protein
VHVTKTNALQTLVIGSFVRGLSVRHVEAALAEALGQGQGAISKSTVSAVCQALKEEYQAWTRRRLDGITEILALLRAEEAVGLARGITPKDSGGLSLVPSTWVRAGHRAMVTLR